MIVLEAVQMDGLADILAANSEIALAVAAASRVASHGVAALIGAPAKALL